MEDNNFVPFQCDERRRHHPRNSEEQKMPEKANKVGRPPKERLKYRTKGTEERGTESQRAEETSTGQGQGERA